MATANDNARQLGPLAYLSYFAYFAVLNLAVRLDNFATATHSGCATRHGWNARLHDSNSRVGLEL
jgi:hypothetical protein